MSRSPKYSYYATSGVIQASINAEAERLRRERDEKARRDAERKDDGRRAEVGKLAGEIEAAVAEATDGLAEAATFRASAIDLRARAARASGDSLKEVLREARQQAREAERVVLRQIEARIAAARGSLSELRVSVDEADDLCRRLSIAPLGALRDELARADVAVAAVGIETIADLENNVAAASRAVTDELDTLRELEGSVTRFGVVRADARRFVELQQQIATAGREIAVAVSRRSVARASDALDALQASLDAATVRRGSHHQVLAILGAKLQEQGLRCEPVRTTRLADGTEIVALKASWIDGRQMLATVEEGAAGPCLVYVADGLPQAGTMAGPVTCPEVENTIETAHRRLAAEGITPGELLWEGKHPPSGRSRMDGNVELERDRFDE
jgi:hypothetical protein